MTNTDTGSVPNFPRIEALTRHDGSGEITIQGTSYPIDTTTTDDARRAIIGRVVETATKLGRPVKVSTSGPDGNWPLIVHPDGTIETDPRAAAPTAAGRTAAAPTAAGPSAAGPSAADRGHPTARPDCAGPQQPPSTNASSTDLRPAHQAATPPSGPTGSPPVPPSPPPLSPAPPPATPGHGTGQSSPPAAAPTYSTDELLQQLRPTPTAKARTGWRAWLGLGPSKREQALEDDLANVRAQFPRAVTVMVANPKGGGGKTPTSLLIGGEMGHARGGGVVVWDNNELRGNARDRSYFPHNRGVADLLEAADRLEQPDAAFTELAYFLAHQTHGKYYVLSSDQAGRIVMDQEQVRRVHRILSRFFEVIIIDTGNNEKAPNWLAARDLADCLIVPMKWRQDSILVANRMLATMAEDNNALLRRTLLIGTNGPGDSQATARKAVLDRFSPNHAITEVKTDPHIHAGAIIDRHQLHPRTQRAGLHSAAIVARLCSDASQPH